MISRLEAPVYIRDIASLQRWLTECFRWFSQAESGEFTATLTGCNPDPTGTIEYTVNGDTVTLAIPAIDGTSNTTAATLTGMPTDIAPSTARYCAVRTLDNTSTYTWGLATIATTGVITLNTTPGGGGFTASGTKGVSATDITYKL